MFKTSPLVIAVLLSGTSAVQLQYRPTAGSVPWGGAAARPTWDTPDYPVNYYIPNFGLDHNILTTMNSLKIAEQGQKKSLKAKFAQTDAPADMRIPDLGADEDVKFSLAAIDESQKESGKQLQGVTFSQPIVQYAQSTGMDAEVADSTDSLNLAEKKLNHKLAYELPSHDNVEYNQEWQRLGKDSDISLAQANIAESEKIYGTFQPVKDFNGLWRVGKEETAVQLEANIEILSDPICSSAGCTQYKHPDSKEISYPMDYGVPTFGMDRDVMGSLDDLRVAEGIVKHKWVGIDKEKWHNPAKSVMYNFAPALDGDIIDSRANLAATEKVLDHKYELA